MAKSMKAQTKSARGKRRQNRSGARKKLFVVLGMHRSGTSAIARALRVFDVSLGDQLNPPAEGNNPKGFWEDMDIVSLNADMMKSVNSDWHLLTPIPPSSFDVLRERYLERAEVLLNAKFTDDVMFGIKDPRMARLMPFWGEVFDRCRYDKFYLLALRNPLSVAASLAQRDAFAPMKSYLLWFEHMLMSLRHTQGERRVALEYDKLLENPKNELCRVASTFALDINLSEMEDYSAHFLDHALRHTAFSEQDLDIHGVPRPAQEIYSLLRGAAKNELNLDSADVEANIVRWESQLELFSPLLMLADELAGRPTLPDETAQRAYFLDAVAAIARTDSPGLKRELRGSWYASQNPDIATVRIDPYEHWIDHGRHEGRLPAADIPALVRELVREREDVLRAAHEEERRELEILLTAAQRKLETLHINLSAKSAEQEVLGEELAMLRGHVAALEHSIEKKDWEYAEASRQAAENRESVALSNAERERDLHNKLLVAEQEVHRLDNSWSEKMWAQRVAFENEKQKLEADINALSQSAAARERDLHSGVLAAQEKAHRLEKIWSEKVLAQHISFQKKKEELQSRIDGLKEERAARERNLHDRLFDAHEDVRSLKRGMSDEIAVRERTIHHMRSHIAGLGQLLRSEAVQELIRPGRSGIASIRGAKTLDLVLVLEGEDFVQDAYQTLLGRNPDAEGFAHYVDRLRQGVGKLEILREIRDSKEGRGCQASLDGLDAVLKKEWRRRFPFVRGALSKREAEQAIRRVKVLEKRLADFEAQRTQLRPLLEKAAADLLALALSQGGHAGKSAALEGSGVTLENPVVNSVDRLPREPEFKARQSPSIPGAIGDFDPEWYLSTYPDIGSTGIDPMEHYLLYGEKEGRFCCEADMKAAEGRYSIKSPYLIAADLPRHQFDADWYTKVYPDVLDAGADPLEHYLTHGKSIGRYGSHAELQDSFFDEEWYVNAYPDVLAAGIDPRQHFMTQGKLEGRVGAPLLLSLFDEVWYLRNNPDVAAAGVDPLWHFTNEGKAQFRPWSSYRNPQLVEPEPLVYSEQLNNTKVDLIAFYLPQFHPILENDEWWGRGFTEWTNVTRTVPFYEGHEQPRLPGELGYYDLRVVDVMRRQAELARTHGVYGFCFYIYWFGGKRLLDGPIEMLLNHPEVDINFCYCWANENWTRRWDGLENDILIGQAHSPEDDLAFISSISAAFSDRRYIRVEGKPMLVVYRPSLFPEMRETVCRWRDWCRDNGIGEIHVCYTESFDRGDPSTWGMDASIQFPPATVPHDEITNQVRGLNASFKGQIHTYLAAARSAKVYIRPAWEQYRAVMPSWDNTARKMERGISFFGANPELYGEWLEETVKETQENLPEGHRFVFINAWNEWAEGAYLEPDQRRGYAYLNRTREVMARYSDLVINEKRLIAKKKTKDVAVIVHLHYGDLFEATAEYLDNLSGTADLFFSVRDGCFPEMERVILERYPDAAVASYPNHGRDVVPFLRIYSHLRGLGYKAICKIHSKKSKHRSDGDEWRDDVYGKLLGDKDVITACLDKLESGVGVIAPSGHLLAGSNYWGTNAVRVTELSVKMGCPKEWVDDFCFPAGTMFWFHPEALEPLMTLNLTPSDFEPETGQVDGTTAHAVERLIGLSARKSGRRIEDTASEGEAGRINYEFAKATDKHGASRWL